MGDVVNEDAYISLTDICELFTKVTLKVRQPPFGVTIRHPKISSAPGGFFRSFGKRP
jgi:hypothetical protein